MEPLTLAICVAFILGYAAIALESSIKVNKAAVALLMFVACWTLFIVSPNNYLSAQGNITQVIERHLGDVATTLFFLMGAMTIVEIVDQNGGFDFVRDSLKTTSKRALLWRIAFMTFFLSAILDNLTTSIVMVMVLRKLIPDRQDRLMYDAIVVIAANSGGAFSPIGDVTTIMLWNAGLISAVGAISKLILPSLLSMVVPALIMHFLLKGELKYDETAQTDITQEHVLTRIQRHVVFFLGVGGLIFVPIFRYLTGLPPFMGIMLVLGLLWVVTELFYSHLNLKHKTAEENQMKRVAKILSRIDMATILFFLGILMAVACLQETGVLTLAGQWLDEVTAGNHYVVTGTIGVISSIVDNVPLVAGCMGMYPATPVGDMASDGVFWQLLAYCAGVGGSMLIIGSAAGVVVMGLEKMSFGWYLKRITPIVFIGYLIGILTYYLQQTII